MNERLVYGSLPTSQCARNRQIGGVERQVSRQAGAEIGRQVGSEVGVGRCTCAPELNCLAAALMQSCVEAE